MHTRPPSGDRIPEMILRRVLFPEPEDRDDLVLSDLEIDVLQYLEALLAAGRKPLAHAPDGDRRVPDRRFPAIVDGGCRVHHAVFIGGFAA
jgi:hypothetical protein